LIFIYTIDNSLDDLKVFKVCVSIMSWTEGANGI